MPGNCGSQARSRAHGDQLGGRDLEAAERPIGDRSRSGHNHEYWNGLTGPLLDTASGSTGSQSAWRRSSAAAPGFRRCDRPPVEPIWNLRLRTLVVTPNWRSGADAVSARDSSSSDHGHYRRRVTFSAWSLRPFQGDCPRWPGREELKSDQSCSSCGRGLGRGRINAEPPRGRALVKLGREAAQLGGEGANGRRCAHPRSRLRH